ncbi:hypothetical protein OUZ56_009530 [Daphnia magna]|uniref:Uncharacterized protein n=1 Tax=Daphnia magna TaxID=35525 RepID=A0ABR0AG94_9CRUS|nr:hypothetical protein OUZ56_009530 [Daphnia magna]
MDLESVISDEGVNLESFDSSTCYSSDSDSDYAWGENEVHEHDFNHADLEEILYKFLRILAVSSCFLPRGLPVFSSKFLQFSPTVLFRAISPKVLFRAISPKVHFITNSPTVLFRTIPSHIRFSISGLQFLASLSPLSCPSHPIFIEMPRFSAFPTPPPLPGTKKAFPKVRGRAPRTTGRSQVHHQAGHSCSSYETFSSMEEIVHTTISSCSQDATIRFCTPKETR